MTADPRRVIVLGSTGSVGTQALDVVRAHPDRFRVTGLAAGSDAETLARQAAEFGVSALAVADPAGARRLRELRPDAAVRDGDDGVAELAGASDADVVLNAITGSIGLLPTLAALAAGHVVALANKESLIAGGDLVVAAAAGRPDAIVPVDSEHSALAQCLRGGRRDEVRRLVLTASGGPFRGDDREAIARATVADALRHPTWDMGPVITVNSATLMNKGLELIEAHHLFGVGWDALDVVVHPQSVVHSMVEFVDGSVIAQLSPPDMRLPIQLALGWPQRLPHAFATLDWTVPHDLRFEPLDRTAFPAVDLAERAGRLGGTHPAVLNAANEQAVAAFLEGRVNLVDVVTVVEQALDGHAARGAGTPRDVADVLEAERWARRQADLLLARRSA